MVAAHLTTHPIVGSAPLFVTNTRRYFILVGYLVNEKGILTIKIFYCYAEKKVSLTPTI